MKRSTNRSVLMLAVMGAAVAACGGDGSGGTATCAAQDGFCARLELPATYASKPVKIIVGLYKKLDAAGPTAPPDAVAMQAMNPTISPASPFTVEAEQLGVKGDYYVYASLYNEGGGTFVPVKGVDYTAQTASPVTLGGGSSPDLGAMMLAPAK